MNSLTILSIVTMSCFFKAILNPNPAIFLLTTTNADSTISNSPFIIRAYTE